ILLTNNGPQTALSVVLSDTLPSGVNLVSMTPSQGTYSVSGPNVSCNLGTLNAGSVASVVIVVTPSGAATLTDNVSVITTSSDTISANNNASVVTQAIPPSAQIALSG